jgi:hypothetical protein
LLADDDHGVAKAAVRALGRIGPAAAAAAPALARVLARLGPDANDIRLEAVVSAGQIGPAAAAALGPALTAALADPDEAVREEAARALLRWVPDPDLASRRLLTAVATDRYIRTFSTGSYHLPALHELFAPRPRPSMGKGATKNGGSKAKGDNPKFADDPEFSALRIVSGQRAVLPVFPWPPRDGFYARQPLDPTTLGVPERAFLREVHARLLGVLEERQFPDPRLFQAGNDPTNGFVLLVRMEEAGRGRGRGPSAGSLEPLDQLGALYLDTAGQVRLVAFAIVRDQKVPNPVGPALGRDEAGALFAEGLAGVRILPEPIASRPFRNFTCHVLVYQFERGRDGTVAVKTGGGPEVVKDALARLPFKPQ